MKTKRNIFLVALCVMFTLSSNAQRAKDGDYTASTPNEIVNTYTYLTLDALAGTSSIAVNNNSMVGGAFGGALAQGDLILIIQMQGASVNINPTPGDGSWGNPPYTVPDPYLWTFDWDFHIENWGEITAYGNAGKFEKVEVESVSGANTINLTCGLENSYNQSGKVQIVRIPRFNNLTINNASSIVPSTWDGQTGGIVAVEVDATLDMNAGSTISASDEGFRAGQLEVFMQWKNILISNY